VSTQRQVEKGKHRTTCLTAEDLICLIWFAYRIVDSVSGYLKQDRVLALYVESRYGAV
jgi:hypothetical protein